MSQIKVVYAVRCDNCPYEFSQSQETESLQEAEKIFEKDGWIKIGNRHICPLCVAAGRAQ